MHETLDTTPDAALADAPAPAHPASAGRAEEQRLAAQARKVAVIEPGSQGVRDGLRDVWAYRELLKQLVWRDFSSRYRQSLIGIGWAVIRPALSVLVFTLVSRVAKFDTGNVPPSLFILAGLLPWMYFAGCLTGTSGSVVAGRGMLTKVYFPRLVLPISKIIVGLIDFSIQLVMLFGMLAWYGIAPGVTLLAAPLFLGIAMMVSLAVGLWLTAINVKYRDVQHAVPFLAQMWMWISPVVIPSSEIPPEWRLLYGLNPMVAAVDGFRWAVVGQPAPDLQMIVQSAAVGTVLLISGLWYFQKSESEFADLI